jgi:hypothetical protein
MSASTSESDAKEISVHLPNMPDYSNDLVIWCRSLENGNLVTIDVTRGLPEEHRWCTQALETFPLDTPQATIDERLNEIRALSLDELVATYY